MLARRLPATLLTLIAAMMTVMLSASIAAPRAQAAEPGVVPDLTWYTSDSDKQRTVAAIEDVGSKWVRLNVKWAEAEPVNNAYNEWWLKEYEKAIALARGAGQRVIVMVDTAPIWASGSPTSNVPSDPRDYADFMSYLSSRLRGTVDAYEVWNEPNLKRFWSTGPDASRYAALLKATYPRIKASDPVAQVVFGGTSGNDYEFLEAAYAAGAKGSFDVMATHPYPYCGSTGPADVRRESDGRISKDSYLGYREVRATMAAQGDAKPIWFTEFGWNTSTTGCNPGAGIWQGGVSEADQAKNLYEAYKLIEGDSYVEVALWYDFRNNYWMKDADTPEARYGLLRTDFSPKPAYDAYKAYANGQPFPGSSSSEGGSADEVPVATATKLKVKVKAASRLGKVAGRVRSAGGGLVELEVERERSSGSGWQAARSLQLRLNSRNGFSGKVRPLPGGRVRIRATYAGTNGHKPSRSRFVYLRLS